MYLIFLTSKDLPSNTYYSSFLNVYFIIIVDFVSQLFLGKDNDNQVLTKYNPTGLSLTRGEPSLISIINVQFYCFSFGRKYTNKNQNDQNFSELFSNFLFHPILSGQS